MTEYVADELVLRSQTLRLLLVRTASPSSVPLLRPRSLSHVPLSGQLFLL